MRDTNLPHAGAARTDQAVPAPFQRAKESIWRRLANWFWGYDYFISYHWPSGGVYAVALAQRLQDRNFEVFLDRAEFTRGDDWKEVGERAIRNTQRFVLVATREAVSESAAVEHELCVFTSRGRHVVPIVFTGDPAWGGHHSLDALDRSQRRALAYLASSKLHIPDDHSNLKVGPSKDVIRELEDTHKAVRRRNRRALAMGVVATVLIAFSTLSFGLWVRAYLAQRVAEAAQRDAEASRDREKTQRERAEDRARVATSRQLAALSASEQNKNLDFSLILAVEGLQTKNTFEARDSLFKALHARPGLRTFLHVKQGEVTSVAFSPDGRTVAAAFEGAGGGVVLWDAATGQRLKDDPLAATDGEVTSVAFSPDGKTIAAGYLGARGGGGVVLWDTAAGRRLADTPLAVKEGKVTSVAFSPDGRTIAAGYQGDTVFGLPVASPVGGGVALAPPVTASTGFGGVVAWDAAARKRLAEQPLPVSEGHLVTDVAFSPDGKTLAAAYGAGPIGSSNGGVRGGVVLWDTASRKRLPDAPLTVNEGMVHSVAFSPEGKAIAVGYGIGDAFGSAGGIVLWDAIAHTRLARDPLAVKGGSVRSVAFSRVGKSLAAGYGRASDYGFGATAGIVVCDSAGRERLSDDPLPVTGGPVTSVTFSRDGKSFAAGYRGSGVVLWDATAGERLARKRLAVKEYQVNSVAFSPDGKTLAAGYYVYANGYVGGVVLWDAATGERLRVAPFDVKKGRVVGAAFSSDGKSIAAAYTNRSNGGGVVLWNAATGERVKDVPLAVHDGNVYRLAFSREGKTLAVAHSHGVVLWDARALERLRNQPPRLRGIEVTSVAFSPDGTIVAAGYEAPGAGGVALWDTASGTRLPDERLSVKGGSVRGVAFTPDGKTIAAGYQASGASGVALWDAATREPLSEDPLAIKEGSLQSMSFSPDGKTIAAAFGTGVVLWDTLARERLMEDPLFTTQGRVSSIAFHPDGKIVAAACDDGVVLWDIDLESWTRIAGRVANRNFTTDESRRYFPEEPYHRTFRDLPDTLEASARIAY
jgi:WD40 repeat protein